MSKRNDDADREIRATRIFDAPRELVFKMWTDPELVAQWWGPDGFTNTIYEMDVRPGGVWRFVMHGPDGVDYQNKFVYEEIVKPERIVLSHVSGPLFHSTVTFAEEGGKTRVSVRMLFESARERDDTVKKYGAIEGLNQNLNHLGGQLAKIPEFNITRIFDAPRRLVWKAWTEPERMMKWWGPKGFTMLSCKLDLRPGGVFHYHMQSPDGGDMWGKFVFREIVEPERLVYINSFSDRGGNTIPAPFSPPWPVEMHSTVTFAEQGGRTEVKVRWFPLTATEEERRTFDAGKESMKMGFTGTFDQLAGYLARV